MPINIGEIRIRKSSLESKETERMFEKYSLKVSHKLLTNYKD